MDPISALGIAAAAFQFADVGGKICAKAWEKYKQMRQETDDNQKLAEEEEELSETLEDLSFQVSWMRQISQRINASIPITSTELQLSTLSSQCIELSEKFEQIKNQIKPPNNSGKRSEIHWLEHTRSYRHVREKDCRECQKKKDEEEQEFYRNKDNIEKIKTKLESFKRKAVDFILISLWEDSKDTKRQDLHFSSQLDKLIDLLKCPEELATDTGLTLPLTNQVASTLNRSHDVGSPKVYTPEPGTAVSTVADEEVVRLMTALQPLIQPRDGSLSLKQLAEDIVKTLEVEPEATATIREELIKLLWKTDGKLDTSMTSAKISNNTVARAIVTGMQFSTIRARENAISKNYEATYSWIFQNDPPEKDDVPMWYSFPKWLEDDTKNTYWITGKPGSGKSTIMKLILQQNFVKNSLSLSLGSMRLILVKYYAWSAGTTLQKSIDGLKRTIISQALEQYPELTQALAPRRWAFCQVLRNTSGLPMWTAWELEESFEALLSSCGQRIKLALFIDGLDEFDGPPFEVIEFIQHMMAKCPKGLKWQEQMEFSYGSP
ncbi:hypothetical protein Trihar35433_9136 [Trichoderma harzianum]|nr:hypothetical protein Trihar35433_9136 [Trichoderma harzianum]